MMRLLRSRPIAPRSTASLKSAIVTASLLLRAASRAASLTRLARSAPTEPGVRLATWRRSTSSAELDVAGVDLQDRLAAVDVGPIDDDGAVEAAGAQQGGVERFGAVGGGHDDDAAVGVEAVHLDEELVERLLAFVVAADGAAAARLAQGVEFVDEDDAGGLALGLAEQVAHAAGADADEHLDEVGAATC